jgi:hypothetical protein
MNMRPLQTERDSCNLGELDLGESFHGLSKPEPLNAQRIVIGRSGLADSDPMG